MFTACYIFIPAAFLFYYLLKPPSEPSSKRIALFQSQSDGA